MRDWEDCYRNNDTPWDKGCAAPPLAELVARLGNGVFDGGSVLVPGCGLGHDVRWLAGAGMRAHGVDLSATAVRMAEVATTLEAATYETADILDPAWRQGRCFRSVWEHTCFCAMDPVLRGDYARAMAELLPSGGFLCGVFYLIPTDNPSDLDGPPFAVTVDELDALFSPWFGRVHGWVPEQAYPGREGREWLAVYQRLPETLVAG